MQPDTLRATARVDITAAAEGEGEAKRPRFDILGYTGEPMDLAGFYSPVIVDLGGLRADSQQIPAFRNHDDDRIVGQTDAIEVTPEGVRLTGTLTGDNDDAREVASQAKNGFRWQASIGATIVRREFVKAGEKATVNGREVAGPILIAREARLREISFVALGADPKTTASVAASGTLGSTHSGAPMTFEQWLAAKGFDPAAVTDTQRPVLQAAFDAEQGKGKADPPVQAAGTAAQKLDQILAEARKEEGRQAEIARIAAQAIQDRPAMVDEIERLSKLAIAAKQSPTEFELEVLRATRATPSIFVRGEKDGTVPAKVLEAAICLSAGLNDAEKQFDERTLEAADRRYRHGLGLKDVLLIAAREHGYSGHGTGDIEGLLRAAFAKPDIRAAAGFSTFSLSGILSNTANKFLRRGFDAVEGGWSRVAAMRSVRDFKQTTSYTLTGGFSFEKVGPAGEIKHATVGEQSYTNQAETYGRMFALTRKDIINDDLGALTEVPTRIGRGAALKLNEVFWTAFLADVTTFFTTGRGNYFEGAATNLQSSSLQTATRLFRKQTDPDGFPLGIAPRLLVVPPELEITADELMTSTAVNTGGSSSTDRVPNRNVWASKYEIVMSTYLSNTSITNNSATAWFLLADPMDLPMIEVAFLNGRQQPTVESADADFSTLGIQMRGYFDFGVNKQEYRAGVRSKGAA